MKEENDIPSALRLGSIASATRPELLMLIDWVLRNQLNPRLQSNLEYQLKQIRIDVLLGEMKAASSRMMISVGTPEWVNAAKDWDNANAKLSAIQDSDKKEDGK